MQSTMHTVRQFEKGTTVYLEFEFRDLESDLTDTTSTPTAAIKTAAGAAVTTPTMVKKSTGTYYFNYVHTEVGDYYVEVTGVVSTRTIMLRKPYRIIESVKKY